MKVNVEAEMSALRKWYVCFSLLVQEQTVLISSLDILLFSSVDLTRLNFFEFILLERKTKKSKQI